MNKSSRKVYGAHIMVFHAQFSNFIEFGSEMRQRNDPEVCSTRVINENQSCPGKVLFDPLSLVDVVRNCRHVRSHLGFLLL